MKSSRVLLATGTAAAGSDDRPRFIQIGIVVALLRLLDPKKFQNVMVSGIRFFKNNGQVKKLTKLFADGRWAR